MLTYDEIELRHFTGMWLNNIKLFKMTVTSKFTVILGRNGSGKSRLMAQICPLAPNKKDFLVGGGKTLSLTFKGIKYQLSFSRTAKSLKCSIVNVTTGETVISDANPTVHNDMVKELFNYDVELHELLIGKKRALLTEMNAPLRKKWFSMLSESDLTFALQFFKKARENHRDITGNIKSLKLQIGQLSPKVLENEADRLATERRITELQAAILEVDREIEKNACNENYSMDMVEANTRQIERLNAEVMRTDVYTAPEIVGLDPQLLNNELIELNTEVKHLLEKQDELMAKLEHASKLDNIDAGAVERKLQQTREQLVEAENSIHTFQALMEMDEGTIENAKQQYNEYGSKLINALLELDCGLPVDNLRNRYDGYVEQTTSLNEQINKGTNGVALLLERVKHIDGACDVTCDNCNHSFKPGIKPGERDAIMAKINGIEERVKELTVQHEKAKEMSEKYHALVETMRGVGEIVRYFGTNVASKLLFDELIQRQAWAKDQSLNTPVIREFEERLKQAHFVAIYRARVKRMEEDLAIIKASQQEDFTDLEKQRGSIEQRIERINSRRADIRNSLTMIDETQKRMTRLNELDAALHDTITRRAALEEGLVRQALVEEMTAYRTSMWDLLVTAKQRFAEMDDERKRLEFMREQLEVAEGRHDCASKVVEAMSPENGILAKYLYKCITKITELMTSYINSIWGYEIQILPCEAGDGELDYKFPWWAKSKDNLNSDVSEGSTAQKEVFNFVFMLSVYRARALAGYPLLLDELGSGFDEEHRTSMINFVRGLIDLEHHSQLFMVSHDAATHFQLSHADICVIDPAGVSLPKVYNKNVVIK